MKIVNVVGARPNFIKIASLIEEMKKNPGIKPILVHTGQHYHDKMSDVFFRDLGIDEPEIYIGVGSDTHASQTAKIMVEFEKICFKEKPDLVLVVGDVNSTLAASLVAAKLNIPIAHVEAGLRSFDRRMPEEINRMVTDSLSSFLFTTSRGAGENLIKEGVAKDKIYFVGNVMIDTLLKFKSLALSGNAIKVKGGDYALLTLHRPSNVDDKNLFKDLLETLKSVSKDIPIIFPVHPRTKKQVEHFGLGDYFNCLDNGTSAFIDPKYGINAIEPLSYVDFLSLMTGARFVLTDSGGIQEETTILGTPCLTLRENTERPVTVDEGTNIIVGTNPMKIKEEVSNILNGSRKNGNTPELWDGKASERIVKILSKHHK